MDRKVIGAIISLLLLNVAALDRFDKTFWYDVAEREMQASLQIQKNLNWNVAKNLILVIGDGMGVTTTTAARILKGQREQGVVGAAAKLSWDSFPHTGFSRTYDTDHMTTDSAASATAYHCGVKTKSGIVGLDDQASSKVCGYVEGATVNSVLDWSLEQGKSVGIVSTDRVTGASPSASYAHSPDRNWQTDAEMDEASKQAGCKDIAAQLVDHNIDIQVILGGGRAGFLRSDQQDPEYPQTNGSRLDGRNLMEQWELKQTELNRKQKVVWRKKEFEDVDPGTTDYLLGLFETGRMQEETIRVINNTEPSLAEMVDKAIKILSKNSNGFYLFVEGANIDIGHHQTRARFALEETLAMDKAVEKISELTDSDDTLVVVSADHSHTISIGGYSTRGENVLGLVRYNGTLDLDENNGTYTILSYGNGPGYGANPSNMTMEDFEKDQLYAATFKKDSETHGAEDVAIYASGPMSHLFTGTHEQVYLAHGFAYAACLNGKNEHCSHNAAPDLHNLHIFPQLSMVLLAIVPTFTKLF